MHTITNIAKFDAHTATHTTHTHTHTHRHKHLARARARTHVDNTMLHNTPTTPCHAYLPGIFHESAFDADVLETDCLAVGKVLIQVQER